MITATATEVQNNFDRFLKYVSDGNEVIIIRNVKEVACLISQENAISFLTDSLRGVLKSDYDEKKISAERIENCKFALQIARILRRCVPLSLHESVHL